MYKYSFLFKVQIAFYLASAAIFHVISCQDIVLKFDADDSEGRIFDGIGAISGGGATTKLLHLYPEKELNEIIDILFKSDFMASLHALKVEIGGDAQSTEGSEASHMRSEKDENYHRGYEWFIMDKAKQANENIIFHSLPWSFPGWCTNENKTANYIVKWIQGASKFRNFTVSTVGCWNERTVKASYIRKLRETLDAGGFNNVGIVALDTVEWEILDLLEENPDLNPIIHAYGAHYPHMTSPNEAKKSGIRIWASEDYSTYNDDHGAGCWARTLNGNYVYGQITSYNRCSLMNAQEPWSGMYTVNGPIWVTMHHTHFYKPGWKYLSHGKGVGILPNSTGTYISLISPDMKDFSIVVETLVRKNTTYLNIFDSMCLYDINDSHPIEGTLPSKVFVQLEGSTLSKFDTLYAWSTIFDFAQDRTQYFKYLGPFKIQNRRIELELKPNMILTLSTRNSSLSNLEQQEELKKKIYEPEPTIFPLPYNADFSIDNRYYLTEADYLTPQYGYFEKTPDPLWSGRFVLSQVVSKAPVAWCDGRHPIAIMGDNNSDWSDVTIYTTAVMLENADAEAIFVGARIVQSGCWGANTNGVFFWLNFKNNSFMVSTTLSTENSIILSEPFNLSTNRYYDFSLSLRNTRAVLKIDNEIVKDFSNDALETKTGFVGLGSLAFGPSAFKAFRITRTN